jgi:hypothetical protein
VSPVAQLALLGSALYLMKGQFDITHGPRNHRCITCGNKLGHAADCPKRRDGDPGALA